MSIHWRLISLHLFFLLLPVVLVSRLFYWQVLAADNLLSLARSQQQTTTTVSAKRGEIFLSDNSYLVANQPAYNAFFVKNKSEVDLKTIAETIAPLLNSTATASLYNRLSDPNINWVTLGKKISQEQKWSLESLAWKNLSFEPDQSRFYPEASMAAHLIGFVGQDDLGKDKGVYGLEGFYQAELAGQPGILRQEHDAFSQPIIFGQFFNQEPRDGRQLKLFLDKGLQFMVEKKLASALDRYGAKSGSVAVMDPFTGAILAMASLPAYEPAKYSGFEPELFLNPVVADAFEPGSIFKIVVMAAAMNENLIKPDTICDACAGPIKVDKYFINTWDNQYRPNETMTDVIVHSDNVGMVFVGQKLGLDKFLDYFKKFGFSTPTNIDLQDEQVPPFKPDKQWTFVDLATASFGQGFLATGMQLLQATAAIANGGELVEPRVVNQIISDRQTITLPVKARQRVISQEAAQQVTGMMVAAVKDGEAKWTNVKGYQIAGKTGTAQVAVGGKYAETVTNASFIGFAPADKPKFVMLVTLKEPKTSQWASETAAPLWFSIAAGLLNHFNIVPML
ncbi:MAG: penicillin-binding protein 2 [Patescibacteria group bacterium]